MVRDDQTRRLSRPHGKAGKGRDRIFDRSLLLEITQAPDGGYGLYDFVIA